MELFLITSLAIFATLIPLWLAERHGLVRLVSPMHLLAYFCLFGFLVKVVAYAIYPDLAFYTRYIDSPSALSQGALYLTLFVLALCIGYRLACTSVDRMANTQAAQVIAAGLGRAGALSFGALTVTLVTIIVILRARGLGGLDAGALAGLNSAKQINVNADGVGATLAGIKSFFIIPKFAFILLLAHAIVIGARRSYVLTAALGVLLIIIALVSGDRFELVELIVFAVATYMIVGGQLAPRIIWIGLVCILGLCWLSAYMTSLRHGGDGQQLLGQIVGSTYFLDINAAVMVTDRVTPDSYMLGESYTWWSFGWIPRAFWEAKPAIDLGVFFKRDVMGIATGGAFNVTGPGEAFMNFGWAGIGVAGLLGWVFRKGEAALLAAQATLRHGTAFLYPILFYPFIQATLQSSFSAFIVGAAAQALLITGIIALCLTRYRVTAAPTASKGIRYAT